MEMGLSPISPKSPKPLASKNSLPMEITSKKNWLPMKALEYAGPLLKMGRKSKLWITRWHVINNHTMYIYDSDSAKQPKRKSSLTTNNFSYRYRFPSGSLLLEGRLHMVQLLISGLLELFSI